MTTSNLGIIFIQALGLNSPDLFNFLIENCKELFGESLVSTWMANGGPSLPVISSSGPPSDIPLPPSDIPLPPSDIPLPPGDIPLPPSDNPLPPCDLPHKRITSDSSEGNHLLEDSSEGSTGNSKIQLTQCTTWAATNPRNEFNQHKSKSSSSLQLGHSTITHDKPLDSNSSPVTVSTPGSSSRSTNTSWLQRNPHSMTSAKRTATAGSRNNNTLTGFEKKNLKTQLELPPTEEDN